MIIFSYELFVRLEVILIPLRDQRQRNFCWVLHHTMLQETVFKQGGGWPVPHYSSWLFQRYIYNTLTSEYYIRCGCFFSEPQSFSLSYGLTLSTFAIIGAQDLLFLTDKGLYSLRCLHCHFIHMLWWGIKFYSRDVAIIILAYATG